MEIQKPKGTYDLYGDDAKYISFIEDSIKDIASLYNYNYIRTPIFEKSELFHRGVGETTDIISKETYDFLDRGNRSMTLRPEGTAGVVRSFIENKMYTNPIQPVKLFYYGPMYRYERPQAGRFREHYQFGVEVFGSDEPMIDAEIINIPVSLYKKIGLKGIRVNINTLGDSESRSNYRSALMSYFKIHLNELCEDCNNRYEKNPLRILDCKIDAEKDIMKNLPKISDYLSKESSSYFSNVKKYLEILGINYQTKETLVRGLDYYDHTIFEVEANIEGFGSNNVLCGGGRYNTLVETLGGPKTPGMGFGMGIERLLTAIKAEGIKIDIDDSVDVFVIYISASEKNKAIEITSNLRNLGYKVDIDYMGRNLKAQFKQADRLKAKYLVIIGEDEVKNNIMTVKINYTDEEYRLTNDELTSFLEKKINLAEVTNE